MGRKTNAAGEPLDEPTCTFCGKSRTQCLKLIQARAPHLDVYICDECVQLSMEIILHDFAQTARAATALPPPPCTGAGLVPPHYQGMTMGSSTGFEPAPCSICGQDVAVDGMQRTVNHPYRPVLR